MRRFGRPAVALAAAAIVVAVLGAGCGGGAPLPEAGSRYGDAGQSARRGSGAGAGDSTYRAASLPGSGEARDAGGVASAAGRQAASLFLAGFAGSSPTAPGVQRAAGRGWGGVVLQDGNGTGRAAVARLTRGLASAAAAAGAPPPLVVAAPEVAGTLGQLPAQGDAATPAQARAAAQRAAGMLRGAGIGVVLDPSADVGWAGGAWHDAAFSADPEVVARATAATVDGWLAGGAVPVPGHFPGEGGASGDPTLGPATVGLSIAELRAADLLPFEAVARSAPAIQMSAAMYAAWDGVTPASVLPEAVRMLRATGFGGAIVSADLTAVAAATGGSVAEAAVDALKAGCDLLWVPGDAADQDAAVAAVADAIRRGRVAPERVREAAAHIAALRTRVAAM